MPKKKRATVKRVSAKTRAEDDRLRAELRRFDIKKFERVLGKAIKAPAS